MKESWSARGHICKMGKTTVAVLSAYFPSQPGHMGVKNGFGRKSANHRNLKRRQIVGHLQKVGGVVTDVKLCDFCLHIDLNLIEHLPPIFRNRMLLI